MFYQDNELKTLINVLIKYHESFYEMNAQKAEDGLNGIIDVFDECTEVIQILIENNKEKIARKEKKRLIDIKEDDLPF